MAEARNDTLHDAYREAVLIRTVEQTFLDLFAQGRMNGTVHTCIGQELPAVALGRALGKDDYLVSNHRCHGHYLARTGDVEGLMAELMGLGEGVCAGIGSSQHLCDGRFFSNGVQGGMTPVAAGLGLAAKLAAGEGETPIACVCIGDGTLGQGVVYETLNLASLFGVPLLMVCENNGYAQTTPTAAGVAGDILARAEAFGVRALRADSWHPEELFSTLAEGAAWVRAERRPLFVMVETYRLAPHSKGDDTRDPQEVSAQSQRDPLNRFAEAEPEAYAEFLAGAEERVRAVLGSLEGCRELEAGAYCRELSQQPDPVGWKRAEAEGTREGDRGGERVVERINAFFHAAMAEHPEVLFLGQDVLSPYGGAFKVARGLSDAFPGRVLSTPISEAGTVGLANGLALGGFKPFVEIMFGDFLTLAMDQLVNHAAKFEHMYNFQVRCPLVVRTPMGGGRGYGPTHSQTLDKMVLGMENLSVAALNALLDPALVYSAVLEEQGPVVVLENKLDYGRRTGRIEARGHQLERSGHAYPWARLRPLGARANLTVVAYGGAAASVADCLEELFVRHEIVAELLVPQLLYPLETGPVQESVSRTGRLCVVEEGAPFASFGAEVVARAAEAAQQPLQCLRIGAQAVPLPSCRGVEQLVLPGRERIVQTIGGRFGRTA